MTEIEARSVGYLTNLAGRLLARALSRRLDGIGLSIAHMPVLAALSEGAAMTQKDLAAHSALVSLTPAAASKMKQLNAAIAEVNAAATAAMTKAERAEYRRLIGKIIAALDATDAARD
jgi:DNA-binding MarR family transcriptional regulator